MLRLAFDFIITWRETRTRPNAYSIFEVSLKLAIAYLLLFISYDKLIVYSILVFCVALLLRSLYCFYCKRHFEECHYTFSFNIEQFREMFAFAG